MHGDLRSPNTFWPNENGGPIGRTTSGSRLPAAIIDACTAMASRFARKGAAVSMKTVWPSDQGGSPGGCPSTATGRPAKAVANMPKSCKPVGISAFRHRPPPPSILTKYLFQSRGPARSESTRLLAHRSGRIHTWSSRAEPRRPNICSSRESEARRGDCIATIRQCRPCSSSSGWSYSSSAC